MPSVSVFGLIILIVFSKAVLAYIHGDDAERAKEQLQDCPAGDAATQYLSFLVAINTGRETAGEFQSE